LASAISYGFASNYFFLADQHLTQSEPAFCGLATLCLILNAAAIDPQRPWKGVWRWFDQEMLDCCRPLESVKEVGITLDEFACLARCNTLHAIVIRNSSLEKFRWAVRQSTSSQGATFLAASYGRKALGQTGEGHFSPIAAYTGEAHDMILVLDVARFKYGSYWIALEAMWKAINTIDPTTGQIRGYCMLSKTATTTDDPQFISLVRTKLDNLSVRALFQCAVIQQSPTLPDLQKSKELKCFAGLVELIPVDSLNLDNLQRAQLLARRYALLKQMSLEDLFYVSLHSCLVDLGLSKGEPNAVCAEDMEVTAAQTFIKSQLTALHAACC
jgi:glutathione gamma-glutamylcysteinyltransferase